MKRSAIAMTALLALCTVVLVGCTFYTYQWYDLRSTGAKRDDGTLLYVSVTATSTKDEAGKIIRLAEPYDLHFALWGYFESLETIDAWIVLNGKKLPFPLDTKRMNADRVMATRGDRYIFPSEPDFILDTPWESIESLELNVVFTATRDGVTKRYHLVAPFRKVYEERKGNPFWDAVMSV